MFHVEFNAIVTHEQVRVLFTAMEHNESLEYIDLGDNGITDEGVTYIADLLQAFFFVQIVFCDRRQGCDLHRRPPTGMTECVLFL